MFAADSSPAPKTRHKDGRAPKKSKPITNVKKTKSGLTLSVRFVAPTDAQLTEVARVLNKFLDK